MYTWIFACGIIFAFYNAWGIGANDCANSFATAVGSKTLTLKQAILVASVFEFCGAVLMGSHVTDAVRKNIVSEDLFTDNPGALMFGMLCADLASALWLTFATYVKWPVSTTHSIIGAIIGFSLAYGGADGINWNKVGLIVASWFASPLIAGVFSLTIFSLVKKFVFDTVNPYERTARIFPVLTFITFFINTLFIIYKGSPQLDLDEMPIGDSIGISFGFAFGTGLIAWFFYVPYAKRKVERATQHQIELGEIKNTEETEENQRTCSYTTALAIENTVTESSSDETASLILDTSGGCTKFIGNGPVGEWFKFVDGSQEEAHAHFIFTSSDNGILQIGETGFLDNNTAKILVASNWEFVNVCKIGTTPCSMNGSND